MLRGWGGGEGFGLEENKDNMGNGGKEELEEQVSFYIYSAATLSCQGLGGMSGDSPRICR